MNFLSFFNNILFEGRVEDTLDRHPTIPEHIKQDYLRQIPANNAQHLDWVLQQHTKGNIRPEHNINDILSNFNKVKDKLSKKQIHQYKSVDELHTSISPHIDSIQKSKKEKQEEGTETLYSSPTMTIKQHHTLESCVNAGFLPKNNTSGLDKAKWCISVGNSGGTPHYKSYTNYGFHPVYSIEHHHPDGTSNKHMFVYDYNKPQYNQELRNEDDYRPGFRDYTSTRPDFLDNYSKEHPEILKTPIAKFFTEKGRNKYENDIEPIHSKLNDNTQKARYYDLNNDEYKHLFKLGNTKGNYVIHKELARNPYLSNEQVEHLKNHINDLGIVDLLDRDDITEKDLEKHANTSDIEVHHKILTLPKINSAAFDTIVKKSHPELNTEILAHPLFDKKHIIDKVKKGDLDFVYKITDHPMFNASDVINNSNNADILRLAVQHPTANIEDKAKAVAKNSDLLYHAYSVLKDDNDKELLHSHILKHSSPDTLIKLYNKYAFSSNSQTENELTSKVAKVVSNDTNTLHKIAPSRLPDILKHPDTKVDNVTKYLALSSAGYSSYLNSIELNSDDIKNKIHPYIDKKLDNTNDTEELSNILMSNNHLTKSHIDKILNKGVSPEYINDKIWSSSLTGDNAEHVLNHALKHNDHELAHSILYYHKFDHNIEKNYPNYINDAIQKNNKNMIATLANHTTSVSNANKITNHALNNNDTDLLNKLSNSNSSLITKRLFNYNVKHNNTNNLINHFKNISNQGYYGNTDHDNDINNFLNTEKSHNYANKDYIRHLSNSYLSSIESEPVWLHHIVHSNDEESHNNLINKSFNKIPEHFISYMKKNGSEKTKKLIHEKENPLSESFQDLLFKFIVEAKKQKDESSSLPVLN